MSTHCNLSVLIVACTVDVISEKVRSGFAVSASQSGCAAISCGPSTCLAQLSKNGCSQSHTEQMFIPLRLTKLTALRAYADTNHSANGDDDADDAAEPVTEAQDGTMR